MSRPRLVLADDHPETRALLRGLLEAEFDVVGLVEDGPALVRAAALLTPDVIVTDIGMPGMDGISAAAEVLRTNPGTRVVFVSVHNERCVVNSGIAAGGLGYVLKLAAGDDLVPAVRAALLGQVHISKSLRQSGDSFDGQEMECSDGPVAAIRAAG
jgi:DNA-binding NarL/FixJ family response regulator